MPLAKLMEPQRGITPQFHCGETVPSELSILGEIREVEALFKSLVASWQNCSKTLPVRHWHRIGYEKPILLTPLDSGAEEPDGASMLVTGRDIALGGISFAHFEILPCRKVAVTFNPLEKTEASIVTRLNWCRFTRSGGYRSGGEFLRAIELIFDQDVDWDRLRRG